MSHSAHECSPISQVMAHTSMSYGTQVTESWHTHEQIEAQVRRSHVILVSHTNELWHTYDGVGSQV